VTLLLFAEKYLILDFETTGLSPAQGSEVVETGAVRFEGGRVVATFQRLSRPRGAIPAAAMNVHGITDDMVADAPRFGEVLPELLAFWGERILVAHNAPFDRAFLLAALEQAGRPVPPNPVLDTVRLSRRLFPGLPRHDLETLCRTHHISRERGHRALDDALATAELLRILLERAHEEKLDTLAQLLALGEAPPPSRRGPAEVTLAAGEKALLEESITIGERIEITYLGRTGNETVRVIVPYRLDEIGGAFRLVAFDLTKDDTRTFRLDRIRAVRPVARGAGEPS
jgi:DNA polymerase III epsilon subunit family exonuclease